MVFEVPRVLRPILRSKCIHFEGLGTLIDDFETKMIPFWRSWELKMEPFWRSWESD